MCTEWCKPLYERRNKPVIPDELEQTHEASVNQRLQFIKEEGREINKLLRNTMNNIKPNKKFKKWLTYQDYINCVIIDGIAKAIIS